MQTIFKTGGRLIARLGNDDSPALPNDAEETRLRNEGASLDNVSENGSKTKNPQRDYHMLLIKSPYVSIQSTLPDTVHEGFSERQLHIAQPRSLNEVHATSLAAWELQDCGMLQL